MAEPPFGSLTKTYHQKTYAAINPKNPSLSTAGKSILITGGGSGIGRESALSFARSGIASIALLGRREAPLKETATLINKESPSTKVHTCSVDITDRSSLEKALASYASTTPSGKIDIVFANAAIGGETKMLSELSAENFLNDVHNNAISNLNLLQVASPHLASDATIMHTTTGAAHSNIPGNGSYGISKTAAAMLFQQWAVENPHHFVISLHPGIVATDMHQRAQESGLNLPAQDDVSLVADYSVWAASPAARGLGSGKFTWVHWDVDELLEMAKDGVLAPYVTKFGLPTPSVAQLGLIGFTPAKGEERNSVIAS